MAVRCVVDSEATTLAIPESIKKQLDLLVLESKDVGLADGSYSSYDFVGPVAIRFKNRFALCRAIVVPRAQEILLGAIPLEEMDVIIDMKNEELVFPPDRPYLSRAYVRSS
jgi:clan AA aspartic protease